MIHRRLAAQPRSMPSAPVPGHLELPASQTARHDPDQAAVPPTADLGRVRAVIDALPEAVFVTESDGQLRLTNPAADRLFAGQPIVDRADLLSRFEEIGPDRRQRRPVGRAVEDERSVTVRPRDRPNRWYALRSVALDTVVGHGHGEASRPSDTAPGSPAPVAGIDAEAVDPPTEPTETGDARVGPTVFVLRDVTDSRDLRPVREAFLAVLSHELRTPITTIYAGSSVLARRPALSPPATQTLARDISAEAARLYDLVEDLLVLARLERQVLDPLDELVHVQRAIDSAIRALDDRVTGARVERRGDADPPPVHGDSTYVEQACRNLVLGSIRYAGTDPGRELVVDVRHDPSSGEVAVAVLDRGPTLADDDLGRAFELPDAASIGRLAGSGVGPFVCRHLIEAMGGRTWARNRHGGGMEMGFALRAVAPA